MSVVFYACVVGAVREPPLYHVGKVNEWMKQRFKVCRPVKEMVVAVLLSLLLAVPAPAAQNAGSGNPPQRLTEQDLRSAFERAQQALAAQNYPAAERGFKEFLKLDPNSAAAYTNLGVVYMRTGKSGRSDTSL